tara:strand:- start:2105 stop:3622 length:1518 start_codon:yes stop_codon:yes gene_type:complete
MNKEDLSSIVKDHLVLIDTSALMDERADIFFNGMIKSSLKGDQKIYLLECVYEELENIIKKKKYSKNSKELAKKGKAIIGSFFQKDLIERWKNPSISRDKSVTRDTDEFYLNLFTELRTRNKLCLISQDKGLSKEIIRLNHSKATKNKIKGIKVLSIDDRAFPCNFIEPTPFKTFNRPDQEKSSILENSICINTKSEVYDDDRYGYKLGKKIDEGGEGVIYDIRNDDSIKWNELCCKIYHPHKLTDSKIAKLELMISNPLQNDKALWSIAWPKRMLYNKKNVPIGYLMPKMRNTRQLSSMIGYKNLINNFPEFNTIDLVKISLKILRIIEKLHSYNVYIGDIQPDNFLIMESQNKENLDPEKKILICLVDTDSFQVEKYPCPGGKIEFTHPDRLSTPYSQYLRTEKDECFAISTLLFNIFMLKFFPYNHTTGGSNSDNMKKRYFPYKLNGKVFKDTPPFAAKLWPDLPPYLQEAFIEVFKQDEIFGINDWKEIMCTYKEDLQDRE